MANEFDFNMMRYYDESSLYPDDHTQPVWNRHSDTIRKPSLTPGTGLQAAQDDFIAIPAKHSAAPAHLTDIQQIHSGQGYNNAGGELSTEFDPGRSGLFPGFSGIARGNPENFLCYPGIPDPPSGYQVPGPRPEGYTRLINGFHGFPRGIPRKRGQASQGTNQHAFPASQTYCHSQDSNIQQFPFDRSDGIAHWSPEFSDPSSDLEFSWLWNASQREYSSFSPEWKQPAKCAR